VEAVAVPCPCVVVDLHWHGRRGDQVFGRGTSEHEFFTPFGWQNLATWRNCVFRHDISELGNMSLDEFGEDSSAFFIPSGEFWASANLQDFGMLIPLDG